MQDRPEAHELLGALAAWLATELAPTLEREQRFGVRVAANVAAIVSREIGPDAPGDANERERMAKLLSLAGEPDDGTAGEARDAQRRVAAAIRSGRLDHRWDATLATLRESVRDKLAVAHPGYDAFEEPSS